MSFKGKVALVTGSSRGIGKEIALELGRRGTHVCINYVRGQSRGLAEAVVAGIEAMGCRAHAIKYDVRKIGEVKRGKLDPLFEEIRDVFGGLDILVNNAATGYNRKLMEQRVKGWDTTMDTNARAPLFASQNAVHLMGPRGGGTIVNMSSEGPRVVIVPEYAVIAASKAALEALTLYMAVELAPMNIHVFAVAGGVVETEAIKHVTQLEVGAELEAKLREVEKRTPIGRMVTAQDLAGVVAQLCTRELVVCTGRVIHADAAQTLTF